MAATATAPAKDRDLMEALVTERWYMLTMDTEVDRKTGIGYSTASETWLELTAKLEYIASRLAGDGFEGEPDTRVVVDALTETISERLIPWAVDHRLGITHKADAA
jgi:hypothetical protein